MIEVIPNVYVNPKKICFATVYEQEKNEWNDEHHYYISVKYTATQYVERIGKFKTYEKACEVLTSFVYRTQE